MTNEPEENAIELRRRVRAKAGLSCDWHYASVDMKSWYYALSRKLLNEGGM